MNGVEAVEAITRRRRSIAEKRCIVEETLVAGASVAAVARSHGVNANQLFGWRRLYNAGRLGARPTLQAEGSLALLPVRIADESRPCNASAITSVALQQQPVDVIGTIHIQVADVQLRLEGRVDEATLRVVLESLRR